MSRGLKYGPLGGNEALNGVNATGRPDTVCGVYGRQNRLRVQPVYADPDV